MPNDKRARQKAARREKLEAQRRAQKRQSNIRRGVIIFLVAAIVIVSVALLANSGGKKSATTSTTSTTTPASTTTTTMPTGALNQTQANALAVAAGCPASPTTPVNNLTWSSAPKMTINKNTTYYAHIQSTQGPIVIKLLTSKAPVTVNNFVFLTNQKYYNCNSIFRAQTGFVNQTGNPGQNNQGSAPGYTIPDELPPSGSPTYPKFSVAMANTGSPNTGGSHFFFVLCDPAAYASAGGNCLSDSYSLFGQVVSGQRAVTIINDQGTSGGTPVVTNRMLKVTITQQP